MGDGPAAAKIVEKKKPGFLEFLKQFEPDYCEDDWDCPSSQHCCDFVVAKTCCSGGIGVYGPSDLGLQYIPSRIMMAIEIPQTLDPREEAKSACGENCT